MGRIIKADGTSVEVSPANGRDYSYEELTKIVGGYIEIIPCKKRGDILVINEEGKLEGLPINAEATSLANLFFGDFIVGDVLLCRDEEVR